MDYLQLLYYVTQLEKQDRTHDNETSQLFQIIYLISQLRQISILAYCSFMESDIKTYRQWGKWHSDVLGIYEGRYGNFGLSSGDDGDLSFLVSLYSCYQDACTQYVTYPGHKLDKDKLQVITRNLTRLRDAYSRNRRYPVFTEAYERISVPLSPDGVALIPLTSEFNEKISSDFIDADGVTRSWSWPREDRGEYNITGHGANDTTVSYMFRAQKLAYQAKSFPELKTVFLKHFEQVLDMPAI